MPSYVERIVAIPGNRMIGMIMRIESREESLPISLALLLGRHNTRLERSAGPMIPMSIKISCVMEGRTRS